MHFYSMGAGTGHNKAAKGGRFFTAAGGESRLRGL